MNIRQLEVFRAIMRDGSLTAAANSLEVSQPAVSKVLHHLENQIGYRLFERINGRLSPTAEAHLLYDDADRVFREMEALREYARKIGEKNIGLLRVGASLPVTFSLLPKALELFFQSHPEVKVQVHSHPKREIVEQLLQGDIDLGLTMSSIQAPTVRNQIISSQQIVVVMRQDDPIAAMKEISAHDLIDRDLISYGSHADVGPALDEAFVSAGCKRKVRIEIASAVTAAPFVRAGLGVALVGGMMDWTMFDSLVCRPFTPSVIMNLSISRNSSRPNSRFFKPFVQALRMAHVTST